MNTFLNNVSLRLASVRALVTAGVRRLYDTLIRPHSVAEDEKRKELILNIILTGIISLLLFFSCMIIYKSMSLGESYEGQSFTSFAVIVLLFLGLLLLSRKGYVEFSAYSLIGFFFIINTYGAYHWGIILPSILLMYIFLIVASSILVSNRFGVITTIVISATTILIQYLDSAGIVSPYRMWILEEPELVDAFKNTAFFFIIMLISWLSNSDTERSLKRARASELALKEERDSLEIKVERRTEELRQAQAEKMFQLYRFVEFGRLSSGLFHDLVNPLFSLASNIKNISLEEEHHLKNFPKIKEDLRRSIEASSRMEHYILVLRRQMMTEDFREIFSLNTGIEDALILFNYKALKAGIHIDFFADELIQTRDNPLKFQQIIVNLVSNAIDAYDDHAEAGLMTDKEPITIRLERSGSDAVLRVNDHGHGITSSVMSKIFDPFFTTKSRYKGMGLGLSTTKNIVEKHFGGTIKVESVAGKGSMFTISIPIKE